MNNLKNAKTMNKIKILLLALVAFFGIEHAGAQAVKVYKKDGTSFIVPYSRLDKIITRTQPLEWVDLGLPSGIKWAAANVGADYPEDCGYYFAWGELSPKDEYRYEDCLTYNKEIDDISGNTVYDAAAVMYDAARMPTRTEINELYRNCEWEWTTVHGVNGTRFTGLNGNSIFLPAAGYRSSSYIAMQNKSCYFWTSTPFEDQLDMAYFCYADFETVCSDWIYRDYGLSIRAVSGDKLIDIQTGDAAEITDTTVCIPVTFTYVPEEGIKGGIEYVTGSEGKEIFAEIKADGVTTIKLDSLRSGTAYKYQAFAEKDGTRFYGEPKEFKTTMSLEKPAGLEWIDLGLPSGIKWASMNIGARTPEQSGGYFAWGETQFKDKYFEKNSITYAKPMTDISGDALYDAATANWGASSRMPTSIETKELIDNCTIEWINRNGVNGFEATGPNGNSIFFPSAGFYIVNQPREEGELCCYWSSTPYEDPDNFNSVLLCYSSQLSNTEEKRSKGCSVRPVSGVGMYLGDAMEITRTTALLYVYFTHVPENGIKAGLKYTAGDVEKETYFELTSDSTVILRLDSLQEETTYKYQAFVEWDGDYNYSNVKEFTTRLSLSKPETMEWVDMGLPSGIKWASVNIGAKTPEQYGAYFAWGETEEKDCYDEKSSIMYYDPITDITGIYGYDAATGNWGGYARMPTFKECVELMENCSYEWIVKDGVKAAKITGPNGNSILLPAAGSIFETKHYSKGDEVEIWCSNSEFYYPTTNSYLSINKDRYDIYGMIESRECGLSVRPVMGVNMQLGDATNIEGKTADIPVTFAHVPAEGVKAGIEYTVGDEVKKVYADVKADGEITIKLDSLTENMTYQYRAFAEWDGGFIYSQSKEFTTLSSLRMPENMEWVDLGLPSGIKWAQVNIGAQTPEEYGDYFAWGEISPKDSYDQNNYLYANTDDNGRYHLQNLGDISGNGAYDAATANWGGSARMPTFDECDELINCCEYQYTTYNGINGFQVTGPNGNSIFLPSAGYHRGTSLKYAGEGGYYWGSTSLEEHWHSTSHEEDEYYACGVSFNAYGIYSSMWSRRYYGHTIRPVMGVNMQLGDATKILDSSAEISVTFARVPSEGVKAGIEYSVGEEVKKVYADLNADSTITVKLDSLKDNTTYQYRAFVELDGGFIYSQGKKFMTLPSLRMPENMEWVDLGLPSGIKWASVNIGARTPDDYGVYFAWGEVLPKDSYDENNYLYANTDDNGRYQYQNLGVISGNGAYDAATANWGGSARMPTLEEYLELERECEWTSATYNGVNGKKVIGPNLNSIFIPAAGYREGINSYQEGYYWGSTPNDDDDSYAYGLGLDAFGYSSVNLTCRYYGLTIRPVTGVNMQLGDATNIQRKTADIPVTFAHVPAEGVKAGIEYTVGEEVKKVYADVNADSTITVKLDGLKDNTTYQYRAFLELDGGFIYSQIKVFTTMSL